MSDPIAYHWKYQGQVPDADPAVDQSVIQSTPGDDLETPYSILRGAGTGNNGAQLKADAGVLFPTLNGTTVVLPNQPLSLDGSTQYTITGSSVDPELQMEDFLSWHSAHQLQAIRAIGGEVGNKGHSIRFGTSSIELEALVPKNSDKVIIIQQLNKSNIGNYSHDEQEAISETDSYQYIMSGVLGAEVGDSDDVRDDWQDDIEDLIDDMEDKLDDDADPFTDQLKLIRDRMDAQGIFIPTGIQDKIDEIQNRFDRAYQFARTTRPDDDDIDEEGVDASNSSDDLKTVKSGYDNFIAQEKRIRDIAMQRDQLAKIGELGARAMDAPNMIFMFQLYYNLETEAVVAAETEEIQQQNALLKDYSLMQQLLSSMLGDIEVTEKNSNPDGSMFQDLEAGIETVDDLFKELDNDDEAERLMRVVSMFDSQLAEKDDNTYHPIEAMNNINRPGMNIVNGDGDFKKHKKNRWDSFATQLSDAVTLINQNTQIKTNEINTLNSEKNRHFDLANNALRKMSDMVQTISRA